jgi:hypothetical protein
MRYNQAFSQIEAWGYLVEPNKNIQSLYNDKQNPEGTSDVSRPSGSGGRSGAGKPYQSQKPTNEEQERLDEWRKCDTIYGSK